MITIGPTVSTIVGFVILVLMIGLAIWATWEIRSDARLMEKNAEEWSNRTRYPASGDLLPLSLMNKSADAILMKAKEYRRNLWIATGIYALFVVGLVLAIFMPFQTQYWQSHRVTGEVVTISDQFEAGSGEATYGERILTIDTFDAPLLVENPRLASFDVGDDITLTCEVRWVFRNADRWSCDIAS